MRENQGCGHVESGAARMCSRSPRHGGISRALAPTEPGAGRVELCVPREFKALLSLAPVEPEAAQRQTRVPAEFVALLSPPRTEPGAAQRGWHRPEQRTSAAPSTPAGPGTTPEGGARRRAQPNAAGAGWRSPRRWRPASSRSDRCGTRGHRVRATCWWTARLYWAMSAAWAIRMRRRGKKEERVAEGLFHQGRQVREQSPPVVDLVTFVESPLTVD